MSKYLQQYGLNKICLICVRLIMRSPFQNRLYWHKWRFNINVNIHICIKKIILLSFVIQLTSTQRACEMPVNGPRSTSTCWVSRIHRHSSSLCLGRVVVVVWKAKCIHCVFSEWLRTQWSLTMTKWTCPGAATSAFATFLDAHEIRTNCICNVLFKQSGCICHYFLQITKWIIPNIHFNLN